MLISQIFEARREVVHGDFIFTANIDTPEQQDISHTL